MYLGIDWEVVNSILGIYTTAILPNTCISSFIFGYVDV